MPAPVESDSDGEFDDAIKSVNQAGGFEESSDEEVEVTTAKVKKGRGKKKRGGDTNTTTKKRRGTTYTAKEYLLVAKAYMAMSENAITGSDQKGSSFWDSVETHYNALVAQTNKLWEQMDGWEDLIPRTKESIRKSWRTKLAPAVQKFAGICDTNEPKSGELKDDKLMNMYYVRMMEIYYDRSATYSSAIPRHFNKLMEAYKYLREHAKFAQLFPTDAKNQPPGSIKKALLSKRAKNQQPARTDRPIGRERAKADRGVDYVVSIFRVLTLTHTPLL